MILRFGYVSTALSLWEASPSRTVTFTTWKKLSADERKNKLETVTKENLNNTLRTLYFNAANGIELYRFSSSMVPLATHPEAKWDFVTPFKNEFKEIGEIVKKFSIRVSFHPNQFTLFTSTKDQITRNSIIDMEYHYNILAAMGLENQSGINIHIGGAYGNKNEAINRFNQNIFKLKSDILNITTLENDDKTYTALETLEVCEQLSLPFVFDYHHHAANHEDIDYEELLPRIYATWKDKNTPPKFHISSPKSAKQFRAHAEYVDLDFALPFLKALKKFGEDADIMVEAKGKDKAALKLVEELTSLRGFKRIKGMTVRA